MLIFCFVHTIIKSWRGINMGQKAFRSKLVETREYDSWKRDNTVLNVVSDHSTSCFKHRLFNQSINFLQTIKIVLCKVEISGFSRGNSPLSPVIRLSYVRVCAHYVFRCYLYLYYYYSHRQCRLLIDRHVNRVPAKRIRRVWTAAHMVCRTRVHKSSTTLRRRLCARRALAWVPSPRAYGTDESCTGRWRTEGTGNRGRQKKNT